MHTIPYQHLQYKALSDQISPIIEVVRYYCQPGTKILEIGCGTGKNLLALAAEFPQCSFIGIDLSDTNIQQAKQLTNKYQNISFVTADYLNYDTEKVDVIFADSVIHLICAPDGTLFKKLAHDLQDQGRLIVTMPYDCIYNRILFGVRRMFIFLRSSWLDTWVLRLARWLYPKVDYQVLADRIHYLYVIPWRVDSSGLRETLKTEYRLEVLRSENYPATSFAKPKHKVLCISRGSMA